MTSAKAIKIRAAVQAVAGGDGMWAEKRAMARGPPWEA